MTAPSSYLLALPRELRDKILNELIAIPDIPPNNESHSSGGRRKSLDSSEYTAWYHKGVKYDRPYNRASSIPTLLACKQLHTETLEAIQKHNSRHRYKLDVMLVNELELWPTWLHVPELSTTIDEVNVVFRICGWKRDGFGGFNRGCGGPPLITWTFYALLERFLRLGAVGPQKPTGHGEIDKQVSVKVLELDVKTPDVPPEMIRPEDECDDHCWNKKEDTTKRALHPNFLLEYIKSDIEILHRMTRHTARYGMVLYERVGTIRFLLDGALVKEIELGKMLEACKFNDSFGEIPREERLARFIEWKMSAREHRIGKGLDVVEGVET